jgi:hypothetical protein
MRSPHQFPAAEQQSKYNETQTTFQPMFGHLPARSYSGRTYDQPIHLEASSTGNYVETCSTTNQSLLTHAIPNTFDYYDSTSPGSYCTGQWARAWSNFILLSIVQGFRQPTWQKLNLRAKSARPAQMPCWKRFAGMNISKDIN